MKKILALVMVVAMLACFATVANAAEQPEGQIAYYNFDAADEAGLTVHGEDITYADGAVTFGEATYLTADVDLSGLTAMTIALKVMFTDTDANWGFEITSEEAHTYPAEHYIGLLLNGNAVVERYNNTDARPASASVGLFEDEWIELIVVLPEDGSIILYVDGEEWANVPQTEGYDLSIANCIGENPVFQIGKANWGTGEFAAGTSIDYLAVYNKALTADEVAAITTVAPETEAPETEAPETEAPETEAPETEAPETEAPGTEAPATTDAPAEEGGCGSAMGAAAAIVALTSVLGCAIVKKH